MCHYNDGLEYDMGIFLLKLHQLFHSTNVYKISPENKALKRRQRGQQENPSYKGVPVLDKVVV